MFEERVEPLTVFNHLGCWTGMVYEFLRWDLQVTTEDIVYDYESDILMTKTQAAAEIVLDALKTLSVLKGVDLLPHYATTIYPVRPQPAVGPKPRLRERFLSLIGK